MAAGCSMRSTKLTATQCRLSAGGSDVELVNFQALAPGWQEATRRSLFGVGRGLGRETGATGSGVQKTTEVFDGPKRRG